jgi:hypothetical protein
MGLMAKESGSGDFTPIPEGMHAAICYGVYDLGTHFSDKYGKSARKVLIVWEFPKVRIDVEVEGEIKNLPRSISKQYTLSLNEKAVLRKDLESWRSKRFTKEELKGFDLARLLGVPCQLQILHNEKEGKTYSNIQTIVPMPPTVPPMVPETTLRLFTFDESTEIPEATPEWVQNILKESEEYPSWRQKHAAQLAATDESPPDWMNQAVQPGDVVNGESASCPF